METFMNRLIPSLLAAFFALHAHAFEVTTHGALTREAWVRFVAENPVPKERLIQAASTSRSTAAARSARV
jgi:hypothetical protein